MVRAAFRGGGAVRVLGLGCRGRVMRRPQSGAAAVALAACEESCGSAARAGAVVAGGTGPRLVSCARLGEALQGRASRRARQPAELVALRRRMISLHEATPTWPNSRGQEAGDGSFDAAVRRRVVDRHPPWRAGAGTRARRLAVRREAPAPSFFPASAGETEVTGGPVPLKCAPREEGHVRDGVKAHRLEAPQRARRFPERGDGRAGERARPRLTAAVGSRWKRYAPARARRAS